MSSIKKVNMVLLNYNGRGLLEKYLPSVILAAKNSTHKCTVSVIDNKSTDESVAFIKEKYSDVFIYQAKENKVLCSYNEYLSKIDDDVVIFLNTDMKVDPFFVDPLIKYFDEKDLLFVAPKALNMNGQYHGNLNSITLRFGILSAVVQHKNNDKTQHDASVHGGAFDRKKFLFLGGYDDMYLPGIIEDLDLCYRGWKHGWKGLYEPESFYYHEGSASFNKKYGNKNRLILAHRNTFLFFWKNITSKRLILFHIIFLPFLLCISLLCGKWFRIKSFY